MQKIIVVGGGASGMACAVMLARRGLPVTILERGQRLGRKLSATGNGQGNLTNRNMGAQYYFSDDLPKVERALAKFDDRATTAFFSSMGGLYVSDARGRVYPASRQASALTDLLRRELERLGVNVCLQTQVQSVAYDGEFTLKWEGGHMNADAVVLAFGGSAAKNFGTDGSAFSLAKGFGHTVTSLSPALVQLRCNPQDVRGLKGIRVDGGLKLLRDGKCVYAVRGDILFTESGLSGDAVFRASSYAQKGDRIELDFLPDFTEEQAISAVERGGLLCVVNNGLARALEKRGGEKLLKRFPLTVTGTLGFDYAQVTRGGVPLAETNENLMSNLQKNLYLAGELLNVDGVCGGYNLQWAFTSAYLIAEGILP